MNTTISIKQSLFYVVFASLSLSCSGQSENKAFFSSKDMNEKNRDAVYTAFLKLCENTQAENTRKAKSCQFALGMGYQAIPYYPQNVAEAYWVKVKGDQSLLNAGSNQFELRKARAAMKAKEEEAFSAIDGLDDSKLVWYLPVSIPADNYDFDKQVLNVGISGFQLGQGYTGEVQLKTSPDANQGPIASFPVSEDKISNYFDRNGRMKAVLKITFGDFFEARRLGSSSSDLYPTAIVQKVEVFNPDTGDKVMEYTF